MVITAIDAFVRRVSFSAVLHFVAPQLVSNAVVIKTTSEAVAPVVSWNKADIGSGKR
jgi:hypothetical protein